MQPLGKLLVVAGLLLTAVGAWLWLGGRLPGGGLPGDLVFRRGGMTVYFPLVTCLVLSVVLTLLLRLLGK